MVMDKLKLKCDMAINCDKLIHFPNLSTYIDIRIKQKFSLNPYIQSPARTSAI